MVQDLGYRLKMARISRRLEQKEVVEHLNIHHSTLSSYENGHTTPSVTVLMKLAGLYGVSADHLLGIEKTGPVIPLEGLSDIQVDALHSTANAFRETNKMIPG